MTNNEKKLILINCIYNLCSGMSSVFLNVFLYTYTGNLLSMALYTIIRIGMFPIFFPLAGKLAFKKSYSLTLSVGLVLFSLQLLYVLTFKDLFAISSIYVYLSALIFGIAEGFFWLSVNALNQIVTTKDSISSYLSYIGIFNNAMAIISPLISSYLITHSITEMDGYLAIFKVVLIVYIILGFVAFSVKINTKEKPFKILPLYNLKQDKTWKHSLTMTFIFGLHNSLSLVLSGLMLFDALGSSGAMYSKLLALFATVAIIAFMFYKRGGNKHLMKKYLISSLFYASATIILALFPNFIGGIYYGVVNAISNAYFSNCYSILSMQVINSYKVNENVTGRVIVREQVQSLSRCLGMAIIILFSKVFVNNYLIISVITLSICSIICAIYAYYTHTQFKNFY